MKAKIQPNDKNFIEAITAILIIAAVAVFLFVNFVTGYSLAAYVFAAVFGFALSLFYPRSGFYAIVFLTMVFERFFTLVPIYWNRTEYKIYPLDILFGGVILGAAVQYFSDRKKIEFKTVDWLVGFFILASAVYFFVSVFFLQADFSIAFSTFKNYAFYGLFYFAVRFLFQDRAKLMSLIKFILAGAISVIIFIVVGVLHGEGLWTEFTPLSTAGTRILAFPHAFYLSMAALIALSWIAFKRDNFSNFLKVIIPVWTIGIVGSLMRHLWISLFVSIFVLYFFLPEANRRKIRNLFVHYLFAGIVIAILLSYLAFLFPNSAVSKVFSNALSVTGTRFVSTAQISADESLNWRKSVWQSTWQEYKNSLAFGLGYGKKVSVEIGTKYKDFVEIRNIHNSLLTIFIQMGLWSAALLGFVFWLLAGPMVKRNIQNISPDDQFLRIVFLALFVNYLVAFLFQTYLETNLLGIFFWIIMGSLQNTNLAKYENE